MLVGLRGRKTGGNQSEGKEVGLTCYKSSKRVCVRIAAVGRRSREGLTGYRIKQRKKHQQGGGKGRDQEGEAYILPD